MSRSIVQLHFESCGLMSNPEESKVLLHKNFDEARHHIYKTIFNWMNSGLNCDCERHIKHRFTAMKLSTMDELIKALVYISDTPAPDCSDHVALIPCVFKDPYGHFVNQPHVIFKGMKVDSEIIITYYTDDICEKISVNCNMDKGNDMYACAIKNYDMSS